MSVEGFIINNPSSSSHHDNNYRYYHFDFRNINQNMQPRFVRDGSIPHLTEITGFTSIRLNNIGPDYRYMIRREDQNIMWNNIYDSFLTLFNTIDSNIVFENNDDTGNNLHILQENSLSSLAQSLGIVILLTAEPLRFRRIRSMIRENLIENNNSITLGRNQNNEIYRTLVNWGTETRNLNQNTEFQNAVHIIENTIRENNARIRNRENIDFTSYIPIQTLTNLFNENINPIQIFLYFNLGTNRNCNNRGKRELLNQENWDKKFCDLKPQIDQIQGKITSIAVLDENTKGDDLKTGDIYVGTDNGVYLIYNQGKKVEKFNNLNFPIKDIILDGNGSAYVTNQQNEIYHLNLEGWDSKKVKTNNINEKQFKDIAEKIQKENKNDVITSIAVLDQNTKGGNLKAGDTYIGTTTYIYLIHNNELLGKFDINSPTKSIILNNDGSAYVTNHKNEVYHLDRKDWNWIDTKINNMESSDLNKELKLYYRNDKSDDIISNGWYGQTVGIHETFNLGKINPLNYEKITIIGQEGNFLETKIIWKNNIEVDYFSCKHDKYVFYQELFSYTCELFDRTTILSPFEKTKLTKDILINYKSKKEETEKIKENTPFLVQELPQTTWTQTAGTIEGKQHFGLTWYWEKDNYYLQFLYNEWANCFSCFIDNGIIKMGIGNSILLYNEENILETRIPNSKEFYYNYDKSNIQIDFQPFDYNRWNTNYQIINLEKTNPLNYQKIEFLGDIHSECWGTMVNYFNTVYTNNCTAKWGDVHKWNLEELKPSDNEKGSSKSILMFPEL